jgi:hypothetical protein
MAFAQRVGVGEVLRAACGFFVADEGVSADERDVDAVEWVH